MENQRNFIEAFKTWRIQSGMSQKEVADRIGLSRSIISFLETGQQQPDLKHLTLLKERCGVDFFDTVIEAKAPRYGSPSDSSPSVAVMAEMINGAREVRRDIDTCIGLLSEVMEEALAKLETESYKKIKVTLSILNSAAKKI